jgi:transcriptional regulator with XRE-family HTH domain
MDLDEYLFYEKKKNKKYSDRTFAKKVGVSHTHLSSLMKGRVAPSSKTAYNIFKISEGKVDVWKIIQNYYESLEEKELSKGSSQPKENA